MRVLSALLVLATCMQHGMCQEDTSSLHPEMEKAVGIELLYILTTHVLQGYPILL